MNSQQNPLAPQGQLLDPKNKGRARVKIAVFFVLAIHGIGLMALLMQGCRREETPPVQPLTEVTDTNLMVAPTMDSTNVAPADTNYVAPTLDMTNTAVAPVEPVVPVVTNAAPETLGTSEYKVAKGDTFSVIAKKFNVSSRAIAAANPKVDPTKLQIGQTLVIPAAGAATSTAVAPAQGTSSTSNGQVYTVRSGDNLTKIATNHGVSVKALRSANNLTSDRITVGQKLKIPAKSSAK